jgi:hypothetical protein
MEVTAIYDLIEGTVVALLIQRESSHPHPAIIIMIIVDPREWIPVKSWSDLSTMHVGCHRPVFRR